MSAVDRGFVGFFVVAGIAMFALPFCVILNVHPAIWGSISIGMMPVGFLIGFIVAKARGETS